MIQPGLKVPHLGNLPSAARRVLFLPSICPTTGNRLEKISSTLHDSTLSVISGGTFPRYLYYQTFGIDACFRFKRREISSYEKDPELGPGYAYLVAWDSYSKYLGRFSDQQEVRRRVGSPRPTKLMLPMPR